MLYEKDYSSYTKVKDAGRELAFSELLELLSAHYGADRVSIVGGSEIAVGATDVTDKDGFTYELCFTVKPVMKDYKERKTATKTIDEFDRLTAAKIYEAEKSEKERKAEEKAKAKAEKVARDKKAREEKKKEKEQRAE